MYPDHMPGPLVLVFKLHFTVVALKPVRLVKLLVFPEKILSLKTSSAVLLSCLGSNVAEELDAGNSQRRRQYQKLYLQPPRETVLRISRYSLGPEYEKLS